MPTSITSTSNISRSKHFGAIKKQPQSRSTLWTAFDAICPLRLAGSWDNVGPLIDPPFLPDSSKDDSEVKGESTQNQIQERIFLTIDLTPKVFEEALQWGATIIYAYHPPLFGGLKSWNVDDPMQCMMMRAIQHQIAIYSPHSALDAVKGGICDWLVQPFLILLASDNGSGFISSTSTPIEKDILSDEEGAGRIITLSNAVFLEQVLQALQKHLNIPYFRVAASDSIQAGKTLIQTIALCPGAGGSLFKNLHHADLYFTGEMSHHDVLDRVRKDQAVILTEHTRNERGFLKYYAPYLQNRLIEFNFKVDVHLSQIDDDPLHIWPGL
jgi:dinuclear metal center YbgI/SA1388 family protein